MANTSEAYIDHKKRKPKDIGFIESLTYGFNVFCIVGSVAFIVTLLLI